MIFRDIPRVRASAVGSQHGWTGGHHVLPGRLMASLPLPPLEQEGCGLSHPRWGSPGCCPSCARTGQPHDPGPEDGIGILVTFWKPLPLGRVGLGEPQCFGGWGQAPSASLTSRARLSEKVAPLTECTFPWPHRYGHLDWAWGGDLLSALLFCSPAVTKAQS